MQVFIGLLRAILAANPYPNAKPNQIVALFLNRKAKKSDIDDMTGAKNEELSLRLKEIYIHCPDGMDVTKLKIPAAKTDTTRNMNTIGKLITMASKV